MLVVYISNFTTEIKVHILNPVKNETHRFSYLPTDSVQTLVSPLSFAEGEISEVFFKGINSKFKEIENHILSNYKGVKITWQ